MTKVSGFVEWLPEQRKVEEIEALLAKGETDKEIYILKRLQEGEEKSEARLGLHYDLTVPRPKGAMR